MSKDRLAPDTLMLLSGPRSIAWQKFPDNTEGKRYGVHPKVNDIMDEYRSIHRLLTSLIAPNQLIIADTPFEEIDCYPELEQALPNDLKALAVHALPFGRNRTQYLRDTHVYANGVFISNDETWNLQKPPFESIFGEGGAVLSRKDVLIPTLEVLDIAQEEGSAESIEDFGFRVGGLQLRDENAEEIFGESHIDAHASLVEDLAGELHLIATKKYHGQDEFTKAIIAEMTDINDIKLHLVNDANFPPMALNLIQLDDRSIAMTSGAPELEDLLKMLVGARNVHTTDRPIKAIPENTLASIRCLTNTIPQWVLYS